MNVKFVENFSLNNYLIQIIASFSAFKISQGSVASYNTFEERWDH